MIHGRLLAAAAMSAALQVAPALADDLVFTLDNQSTDPLLAFYVSEVGVNKWGDNFLAGKVIPAGESATITIYDGSEICEFDLRFEFESGDMEDDREADLCDRDVYTLHD